MLRERESTAALNKLTSSFPDRQCREGEDLPPLPPPLLPPRPALAPPPRYSPHPSRPRGCAHPPLSSSAPPPRRTRLHWPEVFAHLHRYKFDFNSLTGGFFWDFVFYVLCSTLHHLPPLRFHCVGRMLGSNPGLLRLRHWQSEAVTTIGWISSTHFNSFKHNCILCSTRISGRENCTVR